MRIVVVLGAGATLAQATGVGFTDPDALPPIDGTFFERIASLRIKCGAEITARAKELLGLNPFLGTEAGARPGMEDFFKDLFYDYVTDARNEQAQEAYRQLVSIYAAALRRTTNPVAERGNRGPVTRLLRKAAQRADDLTLITFNHDLILENILDLGQEFRGRWCLRHGYGRFSLKRRFTLSKDADGFADQRTCKHVRPIHILKLHGSLNWYLYADNPERERALLRGERLSGEPIRISRRKQVPTRFVANGHISRPLVVPPVYSKQSFLESFMQPVWRDAASALESADRVVMFGYSMPSTDIEAEKLFQRSLAKNSQVNWVDLVNPDPHAASRYAATLPNIPLRRYPTIDSFLKSRGAS
jgi:hypothetical protein